MIMKKIVLSLALATTLFARSLTAQSSQPAVEIQEQDAQTEQVGTLDQAKKFFASKTGRTVLAAGKIIFGTCSTAAGCFLHGLLLLNDRDGYFTSLGTWIKTCYYGKNPKDEKVGAPVRVISLFSSIPALPLGLAALYCGGKDIKELYFNSKTDEAQEATGSAEQIVNQ